MLHPSTCPWKYANLLRTKWKTEMVENIIEDTGKGGEQPNYSP